MTVDPQGLVFVLFLGLVNWIATDIVVTSVIFEDVRDAIDKFGERIKKRSLRVGRKVCYFLTCALCVGVWIGLIQALLFGGPLQLEGYWAWATFIANGLLYKAPGHLFLQINAWFHNRVVWMQWQARCAENEAKRLRTQNDLEQLQLNSQATDGDKVRA